MLGVAIAHLACAWMKRGAACAALALRTFGLGKRDGLLAGKYRQGHNLFRRGWFVHPAPTGDDLVLRLRHHPASTALDGADLAKLVNDRRGVFGLHALKF